MASENESGDVVREAREAVDTLIEALREIRDFDGDPRTPVKNSVKKSAIARAALASIAKDTP